MSSSSPRPLYLHLPHNNTSHTVIPTKKIHKKNDNYNKYGLWSQCKVYEREGNK